MLNFKDDGCEVVESLLKKETIKYLSEYTFDQNINNRIPEFEEHIPGPRPHAQYCDPVMNAISSMIHPKIEKVTGLELVPTYNHYRVYSSGNSLLKHVDRPGAEIGVSIFITAQYKPDKTYRWKLFADTKPYINNETVDLGIMPENSGICIIQNPGDCLVYRGKDIPHWREEFIGDVGSTHTQLFCHFIDKNGKDYPKFEYDQRPGLGFPHPSKLNP